MLTSHQLPTLDRHEKIVVNTIHKIKSDLLSQTGHIKNKAHQKGTHYKFLKLGTQNQAHRHTQVSSVKTQTN